MTASRAKAGEAALRCAAVLRAFHDAPASGNQIADACSFDRRRLTLIFLRRARTDGVHFRHFANGGAMTNHKSQQKQRHGAQHAPHDGLLDQKRAEAHDRVRHAQDMQLLLKRDAALAFERFYIRLVHARAADPRMAFRRALRKKECCQKQQRGSGQHGHKHAQTPQAAGQPSADKQNRSFHADSYRSGQAHGPARLRRRVARHGEVPGHTTANHLSLIERNVILSKYTTANKYYFRRISAEQPHG